MTSFIMFLHILGALLLVGGMLFFTLIAAPYLRSLEDKRETARHFQAMGKRFKTVGLVAWGMLLVTGPINLHLRGFELDSAFWASGYGKALMIKLILVALVIASSVIHDFVIGPRSRSNPKLSNVAKIVGRSNLVLTLIVVYLAVTLKFGGI